MTHKGLYDLFVTCLYFLPLSSLPPSVSVTMASFLFHKHNRHIPASGPLYMLFLLPATLFPQIPPRLLPPLLQVLHLLGEAFPDKFI